jgi:hypothetical protein
MKIINDRMPAFKRSVDNVMEDALREGARDILINSRTKAPFKKGALRSNSDVKKMGSLAWRIAYYIEYARFQEFGGDNRRKVRNYTTAGTGAYYLRDAGNDMRHKLDGIFKKHGRRARAW